MTTGPSERMLPADIDHEAAFSLRTVAREAVHLRERAVELHAVVVDIVPDRAHYLRDTALFEFKELNRVCLRRTARVLNASVHADGEGECESAVILFGIHNPVALAA